MTMEELPTRYDAGPLYVFFGKYAQQQFLTLTWQGQQHPSTSWYPRPCPSSPWTNQSFSGPSWQNLPNNP